ncbi:MAG: hypothetical protein EPO11_11105, partial [Gammaproteobacteria bacterium]
MLRHELKDDEYEIVSKDVLVKEMVIKRDIKSGEQLDLSGYRYSIVIEGNIGEGATVIAPYNLTVKGDIEKKSVVSANQGSVIAKNIGDESNIKAGTRIEVCTVGHKVVLEARDTIKTLDVGSHGTLISTQGRVTTDNVGTYTNINAFHRVISKDVGSHAKISSEKSTVEVGNIYSDAEITAFSNISFTSIEGDAKLTSKNGELMEQTDPSIKVFRPYIGPNSVNVPSLQHQQNSGHISVNLENANLRTLSIEIPISLFESKATFFAVENKPGENAFQIESSKDK